LLERARRSQDSNPQLCLDSVESLLSEGQGTTELLLFKARSLARLSRHHDAADVWHDTLDRGPDIELQLEALHYFLASFNYRAIKRLLALVTDPLPSREDALVMCIRAAQAVRQSPLALELCERLVELCPDSPVHRCKLGSLYQSFGRMEEAEYAFTKSLSIDPDFQPAWFFLAQLRKWEPGTDHVGDLTACLERQQAQGKDTSAVHYALAKELEDLGLYAESFGYLQSGARQIRQRSAYDISSDKTLFSELRDWYLKNKEQPLADLDCEGPVFVLGMPRTGSTLTDRILSSHSEVSSVGELMCFKRAVEEVCGGQGKTDFFASFFGAAATDIPYAEIGSRYLEMLSPLVGGQRYFIDKMPMNYVFVGLIAKALPGARFVHTKRNPMDTCFSNYKQMFGEGYYGYSYDLEDVAQHYQLYNELMEFWHQQLPGQIIDIEYEQLVAQPEQSVRALLQRLDLPWQSRCMEFHRNDTAVNTASLSQVRQPIYTASVEKWRKFSDQLEVLQLNLSNG
jgi:tetratricopeptide (TPR) repeat protein